MSEEINKSAERTLEGWKEIATFLKRDVRTVMRWEKGEGLPIRRHLHNQRSSVYALPSELSGWLAARAPQPIPQKVEWWRPRPALGLAAAIFLLMVSFRGGPLAELQAQAQTPAGPNLAQVQMHEAQPDGRVSPDGKSFVDTDWSTGNIRVSDLATGKSTLLTSTSNPAFGDGPAWSPDGQRIAYSSCPGDWMRCDMRIVKVSGGEAETAYSGPESIEWVFDWSRDGASILCLVRLPNHKLAMELFDTSERRLTLLREIENYEMAARLSPDGKTIAYSLPRAGKFHIALLTLADRSETAIDSGESEDLAPIWTQDGGKLLFVSDRSGRRDLWALPVRDGKPAGAPRIVYPEIGMVQYFTGWTGDHTLLYTKDIFSSSNGTFLVADVDLATGVVTSVPKPLIPYFVGRQRNVGWSPDGRKLAFVTNDGGPKVYVYTPKTGSLQQVKTGDLAGFGRGRWYASGEALALWSPDLKGVPTLYRATLSGQVEEVYSQDVEHMRSDGMLSGDWSVYVYGCAGDPKTGWADRVCVYDLKHRRMLKELPVASGHLARQVRVSEDGKRVFYVQTARGGGSPEQIIEQPVEGQPRVVATVRGSIRGFGPTPDASYMVYTLASDEKKPGGKRNVFFVVPTKGGDPRSIEVTNWDGSSAITWSPDSKQFGFISSERHPQWIALSNFLPQEGTKQGQ